MAEAHHSGTLSHYRLPWRLLVVGFHPWPGTSLFEQPECQELLLGTHIDGRLSADVPSTRCGLRTWIPGLIPFTQPDLALARLQKMPTSQSTDPLLNFDINR